MSNLLEWYSRNARDLPWRRTTDPYAIFVSEIMLQQTQVKTVIPFFHRWMERLPSIQALAGACSEEIHKLWEGLGYYTRVRNMQRAAKIIVEEHAGRFPSEFNSVLALPGIGRYTAGAICSIAFNQPAPILDGNVIRVLTRVLGIQENAKEKRTNDDLWDIAQTLVETANSLNPARAETSPGSCSALNQSIMELGALICTPKAPLCEQCPLNAICWARKRGWIDRLPNLGVRTASSARRFAAAILEKNGKVLVRQRPGGLVNAHLWEFPNVEVPLEASSKGIRSALETELGCRFDSFQSAATVKHSITRYRVTLNAFRVQLNGSRPSGSQGEWKTIREVNELPFSSAHRRLAALLGP